jgi:hypothetical protein
MKKILVIVLVFFGTHNLEAQNLESFFNKADAFFKANVSNGNVAYSRIHENPDSLNDVLKIAETISISENDKLAYQAFWVNAYNLAVIKGVINNYPIKSPLDDAGFFDKNKYSLGGMSLTLNDIEHKLLRAKFKDPRFHFVLVCGAIGCPPLISEAYLPSTFNSQLDMQTKLALNGSFLIVNLNKKRIEGSEILKWYKEDFTMNGTSEIDFINIYRTEKIPTNFKLSYFPYNWNLNKQ